MRLGWRRSRPRREPSSMGETPDFLADSFPPVGRDQDKRTILDLLELDGNHVVTIHGIEGSGKTTLAKLVYQVVEDRFDLSKWIDVSDSFEFGKVIKKILGEEGVTDRENDVDLEDKLRVRLSGKRFLVVLDDLWSQDQAKWRRLANLLMASSNQGKIIVTTREQSVVKMIDTEPVEKGTVSSPHSLNVLTNDDLLLLLQRYAGQDEIPNELNTIGQQIVDQCKGLPLAVKILASLLSGSREATYWESIRDGNHFEPLLRLIRDLPVYCKDRFFYYSPLLKNPDVRCEDLFDLWMTDGLFESLDQEMSLMKVEKKLKSIIKQRHWDILRDLICHPTIIRQLTENRWPVINASNDEVGDHVVHLFIGCPDFREDLNRLSQLNGLQTLFICLATRDFVRKLFSKKRVSKFKLLRMLVLKKSCLELPSCIDYMSRLKCLNLSWNSHMTKLPSFFNLRNLEILKLEGCSRLKELPQDIKHLSGLKILSITAEKMDGIENLTSLQSLLIQDCKTRLPIAIGMYLTHLTALQSLTIYACPNLDFPEEGAASESLLELKLESLPNLEALPLRINCLRLLHIKCCDKLSKLPDCLPDMLLESIVIENCRQLCGLPEGMPKLQCLRSLEICNCPELKSYLEYIMGDEDQKKYFEDKLHIKR